MSEVKKASKDWKLLERKRQIGGGGLLCNRGREVETARGLIYLRPHVHTI